MKKAMHPTFLFFLLFISFIYPSIETEASSISLDKTFLSINDGTEGTVTANVPANTNVNWTVSPSGFVTLTNPNSSTEVVITPNALITSHRTLTLIASISGGDSAVCQIELIPPHRAVIGITPISSQVNQLSWGQTLTLQANTNPPDATNQKIYWKSLQPNVAEVNQNGLITPVYPGRTTIIATTEDGGFSTAFEVAINGSAYTSITLNRPKYYLVKSSNPVPIQSFLTIADQTTTNDASATESITWVSSDTTVATINNPSSNTATITTLREGETTLIAKTALTEARCKIIVISSSAQPTNASVVRKSNSSAEITWNGTNGQTYLEILRGSSVLQAHWVTNNKMTISDLNLEQTYKIQVNGFLIKEFKLKDLPMTLPIKAFKVDQVGSTDVDLSWSGNPERVVVEIKKDGSNEIEDSEYANRAATFNNLDPNTLYHVFFDGIKGGSFTTLKSVLNFKIVERTSSSVKLAWDNKGQRVYVKIMNSSSTSTIDRDSTRESSIVFDDLDSDTNYKIYIDDQYMGSFKTEVGLDVKNVKMKQVDNKSVELSWSDGPSGTITAEIRKKSDHSVIEKKSITGKAVSFGNLSSGVDYLLYLNGTSVYSFKLTAANQSVTNQLTTSPLPITNVRIIKNNIKRSIEVFWEGGSGTNQLDLKSNNQVVATKSTTGKWAIFTDLQFDREYSLYMNNQLKHNFKLGFDDIENHWAKTSILNLYQKKIIGGYEDGTFLPERIVNREEFVTMLILATKMPTTNNPVIFKDVPGHYWAAPFIYAAVANGIIQPAEYAGSFSPLKPITREEMAILSARSLKLSPEPSALTFTDQAQIKNKGLVGAIAKKKLINGYPDQSFRPGGTLTRAEAAVMIEGVENTK